MPSPTTGGTRATCVARTVAVALAIALLPRGPASADEELPRYELGEWQAGWDATFFGYAMVAAGDLDGDGFDDLLVGSEGPNEWDSSSIYVYAGGPEAPTMVPMGRIGTTIGGTGLGAALAGLGDLDDDGFADVVASEPWANDAAGRLVLYAGGPAGPSAEPTVVVEGDGRHLHLGRYLASVGDIDGDGIADVAVGGSSDHVDVYTGGAGVLDPSRFYELDATLVGHLSGRVAGPGDVNGDGYDDVAAGGYDSANAWSAAVYHGGAGGPVTASVARGATDSHASLYATVWATGDVNGDGFADLAVGGADELWEVLGGAAGLGATEVATFDDLSAVAALGDLDGDGCAELAMQSVRELELFGGGPSGSDPVARQSLTMPADWPSVELGGVAGADLDGDGARELYVLGSGDDPPLWQFAPSSGGVAESPARTVVAPRPLVRYPGAAAPGDFDGDGYADVLVGFPEADHDRGIVYLWRGAEGGLSPYPSAFDVGGADYALEMRFSGVGDLDGDGLPEAATRADARDNADPDALRIYPGSPDAALVRTTLLAPYSYGWFGWASTSAGDVDGDGFGDLLVTDPETDDGAIFLYDGSADGVGAEPVAEWWGTSSLQYLGWAVHAADFDGDGSPDLLEGDLGRSEARGGVRLYPGDGVGFAATEAWSFEGEAPRDRLGVALVSGDVDGDGYLDAVAGASGLSTGAGGLYVFRGAPTGFDVSPSQRVSGGPPLQARGASLASLGDVDGDGTSEVATTDLRLHSAILYFGSPSGLEEAPSAVLGAWSDPTAVLAVGDAAGDGAGDVLVLSDSWMGLFEGLPTPLDGDADGWSAPTDCDDTRAEVYPGAVETPADVIDEDCDGRELCYRDADGDGWRTDAATASGDLACATGPFVGASLPAADCDDLHADVHLDAIEHCDGRDEDCDGVRDDHAEDAPSWWPDADADDWGTRGPGTRACRRPTGTAARPGDCDDGDPSIHPQAPEVARNGVDEDCDGHG